ncbi:MAG: CHASE2 domain-containing protein [Bacteroidetes bacterium]|nr:CHASE2 domain-containing protein [Bacteroidota bacterium]
MKSTILKKTVSVLLLFLAFKATVILAYLIYTHFPVQLIHFEHLAIEDVEFNDIYYSTRGEDDTFLNQPKEVVLINTGSIRADSLFRLHVADLLRKINRYGPAAVGIDLLFEPSNRSPFDVQLADAVTKQRNLVLALDKDLPGRQMFPAAHKGIVNLPIARQHGETVREYYNYLLKDKDTLFSFAFQLAKLKNPLLAARSSQEYLKYSCVYNGYYDIFNKKGPRNIHNNFPAIEATDLLNDKDTAILRWYIENRIVIIGQLGRDSMLSPWDVEDRYMVPTDSTLLHRRLLMPGTVVNANAVQALIKDEHFIEMKGWRHELTTDLILILFMVLFYSIHQTYILHKTINLFIVFASTIPIIFILGPWLMSMGIYYRTGGLFLQIAFAEEFIEIAEGFIHKFKNRKKREK